MSGGEKEIRFIDLFAGVGGFHLGLTGENQGSGKHREDVNGKGDFNGGNIPDDQGESRTQGRQQGSNNNGFKCTWANEWDKFAASVYRRRFPETPLSTGDIREVEAGSIPDHDLLCAGFPCQAFSVAGKRRGLEEARGTLFYEIARVAERKRPRLLLLENVKGLLSHDGGRTFATILRVLGGVGYRLEWQVLNSKWFGVPQNRERVFIIGHLGAQPRRTVFPITEIDGVPSKELEGGQRVSSCLDANYYKGARRQRTFVVDAYNHSMRPEIGAVKTNEASPTSSSNLLMFERKHGWAGGEKALPCVRVEGVHSQLLKYQIQPLKFLNRNQRNFGDEAMTVDTANSTGIREGLRIRRLTPTECEKLQAFPAGWTEMGVNEKGETVKISDSQRYKQMGNAVTVNVIRFLGERILGLEASR